MSTPTDNKNDEKIEPQYLTLADKQPSLIRGTGTDSGRTISTRQLSDNLQTTRDGLINLLRKKDKNDQLQRSQDSGSDDEDDAAQGFGMPVRSNRTGTKRGQQSQGMSGSALHEITNKKWRNGQRGEFGSEEFDPNGVNRFSNQDYKHDGSNSNMGKWGSMNGQRGKQRLGTNDGYDQNCNKNGKLFSSQNPKKDGPLHTRIFIDAFLPSLEGNRIFPLFNYRCAEKIERTSQNFYEKDSRKRLGKQLEAVSSSPTSLISSDSLSVSTEHQMQKEKVGELQNVKESLGVKTVKTVQQMQKQKVEDFQNVKENLAVNTVQEIIKKFEEVDKVEGNKLQKIEELQQLNKAEEIQKSEKVDKIKQSEQNEKSQKIVVAKSTEKTQDIEDLHKTEQMNEVVQSQKLQEVEVEPPSTVRDSGHTTGVKAASIEDKQKKTEIEKQDEASVNLDRKIDQSDALTRVDSLTADEEKLLQKLLHALLGNEELVDFFCEKIISKIAARNDFCGPNCQGRCGGLNTPSEKSK